uniref:Small ribosomal subunit protein uS2c n=1 Tax=Chromera velia TaxID=505693 RepID=D9IXD1_9ALVE|nr:ribosomal protein S2 [Chromera velia]ADJ66539.2 ribosomal protein S2 [Chromera velia]
MIKLDIGKFLTIPELVKANIHLGHHYGLWNRQMLPYLYGIWKGFHIIDVLQTARLISKTYFYLLRTSQNANRHFLFIGTNPLIKSVTKKAAQTAGCFFIDHEVTSGLLTNWLVMKQRKFLFEFLDQITLPVIRAILPILINRSEEEQEFFVTLLTRHQILWSELNGLKGLVTLPRCFIFVDPIYDYELFAQALILKRTLVGLVDSNCNPEHFVAPIPANNDNFMAVKFIFEFLSTAIYRGKLKKFKQSFTRRYIYKLYTFFSLYHHIHLSNLLYWTFLHQKTLVKMPQASY